MSMKSQVFVAIFSFGCLFNVFGVSIHLCPAGYSCANSNNENLGIKNHRSPVPCPAGTFSPLGQYECTPCSPGYYTNSTGFASCEECPVGFMCQFPDKNPVPCPIGTYTACERQSCCSVCPLGTYTSQVGSVECQKCPAGAACYPVSPPSCGQYSPLSIFRFIRRF